MPTPMGQFVKTRHSLRWATCLASLLISPLAWSQATPSSQTGEDEIYELTPFEVSSSDKDVGYYAENTLAGGRLNTKISDLAASITVVTKQQMEDTASLDINDVFRYETGVEGAYTYTPQNGGLRNDGQVDTVAGFTSGGDGVARTVNTANRVRGIGSADATQNYYVRNPQVPFDAYNIQSLEINRGPNSMIFGMGSPAGIVNTSTAQAALGQEAFTVNLRVDDRGSYRGSFSFNQPVLDSLAIYGAVLYDEKAYERKPSYDRTRRQYGAVTWQPFKRTRLRFNIENYNNENRRPNSITPIDGVTPWRASGRPVYNSQTGEVISLDTGNVISMSVMNKESPLLPGLISYIQSQPDYNAALWNATANTYNGISILGDGALTNVNSILYVPGLAVANTGRPVMQMADGQIQSWYPSMAGQYRAGYGTATNPAANQALIPTTAEIYANPTSAAVWNQRWTTSNLLPAPAGIASYRQPAVNDQSIYNWEEDNILQMNFGTADNVTANLEFEQQIIDKLLYFNAGWYGEDFKSVTNYTVSQLNAARLYVDTNMYLPDGTPNPYVGVPYVLDFDPDRFTTEDDTDHYRAMLAFTPDFTKRDGWMRWLGRHQFLALAQKTEQKTETIRDRWYFLSGDEVANGTIRFLKNPNNDAAGNPTGWNYQNTSVQRQYYLGSPNSTRDGTVTGASGEYNAQMITGDIRAYNYGSNSWQDISMTQGYTPFDGGTTRYERDITTYKASASSYFWNDAIITTFGVSRDVNKARNSTTGAYVDKHGVSHAAMTNMEKWVDGVYQIDAVYDRLPDWTVTSGTTYTTGAVVTPFKNFGGIRRMAQEGNVFGELLANLGVFYNEADNFNPPSGAFTDAFGTPLPKPTGEGKDYGFQVSLFQDKLFGRVTFFESSSKDEAWNPSTSFSRLNTNVDTNLFRLWAETITKINMGYDPTNQTSWEQFDVDNDVEAFQDNFEKEVAKIWGQDYDYYGNLPNIRATRDGSSEGIEVQITYAPVRNWSIKFTGSKTESTYTNVLDEFDAWYAHRSVHFDNATAAQFLLPQYQQFATYTSYNNVQTNLTNFWDSYGPSGLARLGNADGIESAREYYEQVVTPQYLLHRDLEGQTAPGLREYKWSLISNYAFDGGPLDGFNVGGSLRWEDEAVIGYYGKDDPNTPNDPTIVLSDLSRPVYDDARYYTDLWVGYTTKIFNDKVRMKLQLNVNNVFEGGRLQVTGVNFDGSPYAYRIIDPRQFVLTAKFDF